MTAAIATVTCPACAGDATVSNGDAPVFTGADFDGWSEDDFADFADLQQRGMLSGTYSDCDYCEGEGVVPSYMDGESAAFDEWDAWQAEQAMYRRMGC